MEEFFRLLRRRCPTWTVLLAIKPCMSIHTELNLPSGSEAGVGAELGSLCAPPSLGGHQGPGSPFQTQPMEGYIRNLGVWYAIHFQAMADVKG